MTARQLKFMQLKFTRSQYGDHSNYSAEKSFDGQIYTRPGDGYIRIGFSDKLNGHSFSAGIGPNGFEELARLMLEVDAQAAIRAFGAAIKEVEIQKREADSSGVVAA